MLTPACCWYGTHSARMRVAYTLDQWFWWLVRVSVCSCSEVGGRDTTSTVAEPRMTSCLTAGLFLYGISCNLCYRQCREHSLAFVDQMLTTHSDITFVKKCIWQWWRQIIHNSPWDVRMCMRCDDRQDGTPGACVGEVAVKLFCFLCCWSGKHISWLFCSDSLTTHLLLPFTLGTREVYFMSLSICDILRRWLNPFARFWCARIIHKKTNSRFDGEESCCYIGAGLP